MDYEASATLKDGTVVRSYHATPKLARDWICRVIAGLKAKSDGPDQNATREKTGTDATGR